MYIIYYIDVVYGLVFVFFHFESLTTPKTKFTMGPAGFGAPQCQCSESSWLIQSLCGMALHRSWAGTTSHIASRVRMAVGFREKCAIPWVPTSVTCQRRICPKSFTRIWPQGEPTTRRVDSPIHQLSFGGFTFGGFGYHIDVCFPLPMAIKNASNWGMLRVSVAGPGNLLGLLRRRPYHPLSSPIGVLWCFLRFPLCRDLSHHGMFDVVLVDILLGPTL